MGVLTYTMADITSPVAPARLFSAFVTDGHNMFPKILSEYVKSVEFVQGDSIVPGSIIQFNFADGAPYKYVKDRVDEIDASKFYIKYTSFEGDVLRDFLDCIVYENTYTPSSTGTHYKMVAHCHFKGDKVMPEDDVARGKDNFSKMFKIVEDYLIANPQVYA